MRSLFVALLVAVVASAKVKAPKGPPPNCTAVLPSFRAARDACLIPLGLASLIQTTAPTAWPTGSPVVTSSPVTNSPVTLSPTGSPVATSSPVTNSPVTSTPTSTPVVTLSPDTGAPVVTLSPVTGAPVAPTPTPAMSACAPAGSCMAFMNNVEMWRDQIEWCLDLEAGGVTDALRQDQIRSELWWSGLLANDGCGMNNLGDICGDGPLAALMSEFSTLAGCPATQTDVDNLVNSWGCCVASFAEISMNLADITGLPQTCDGEFHMGKACKAPKWKLPKNPPPVPEPGKAKKAIIPAAVVGGLVGVGLVGAALRKRRSKLAAARPRQTEGLNMGPAVVAV